jgi:hypothetical protein
MYHLIRCLSRGPPPFIYYVCSAINQSDASGGAPPLSQFVSYLWIICCVPRHCHISNRYPSLHDLLGVKVAIEQLKIHRIVSPTIDQIPKIHTKKLTLQMLCSRCLLGPSSTMVSALSLSSDYQEEILPDLCSLPSPSSVRHAGHSANQYTCSDWQSGWHV